MDTIKTIEKTKPNFKPYPTALRGTLGHPHPFLPCEPPKTPQPVSVIAAIKNNKTDIWLTFFITNRN